MMCMLVYVATAAVAAAAAMLIQHNCKLVCSHCKQVTVQRQQSRHIRIHMNAQDMPKRAADVARLGCSIHSGRNAWHAH